MADGEHDAIVKQLRAWADDLVTPSDTTTEKSAVATHRVATSLAAVLVAAAAIAAIVMVQHRDGDNGVTPGSPATDTSSSSGETTTAPVTTSTAPPSPYGSATIQPSTVNPGGSITVNPAAEIQPICGGLAVVRSPFTDHEPVLQLGDGWWTPYGATQPTWLQCLPPPSSASTSFAIANDFPEGTFVVCLTQDLTENGCGTVTVVAQSTDTTSSTVPATTTTHAPTTTGHVQDLSFTPVSLGTLPDGYHLLWARYETASDGSHYGTVRYAGPDGTPDLALLIRPWSDGIARLPGRTTWEEAGRTVISDGEGNGMCLPDVCSVGVQWDANTYISVMWQQSPSAGLDPQHTLESLVALTANITEQTPPVFVPGNITDR